MAFIPITIWQLNVKAGMKRNGGNSRTRVKWLGQSNKARFVVSTPSVAAASAATLYRCSPNA